MSQQAEQSAEEGLLQEGDQLRAHGQLQQAVDAYTRVIAVAPDNIAGYLRVSAVLEQTGDLPRARDVVHQGLARCPDALDGYGQLLHLGQSLSNNEDIFTALRHIVRIRPEVLNADVQIQVGDVLAAQGLHGEAQGIFSRLLTADSGNNKVHERYVSLFNRQRRLDLAIEHYRALLQKQPELAALDNRLHVNQSLRAKLGYLERYLQELCDELVAPELIGSQQASEWMEAFRSAIASARSGNLQTATVALEQLAQRSPNVPELFYNLGLVYQCLAKLIGDTQFVGLGIQCFQRSVTLHPTWARAYLHLGRLERQLRYDGTPATLEPALGCFERVIQLDENSVDGLLEVWSVLNCQGRSFTSLPYLDRYMALRDKRAQQHPLGKLGIRFLMEVNAYAMGHLSSLPEVYIKMQELGWMPRYQTFLLARPWMVANRCLLDHYRKYLTVVTEPELLKELWPMAKDLEFDTAFSRLPDGRVMRVCQARSLVEQEWDRQARPPLLALSAQEVEQGWNELSRLGMPKDAWFVALHAREGGFKGDWDCPVNGYRNVDIRTYFAAVNEIVRHGGWVVRMGEPTMTALPAMANVIDYAHSDAKSDWMDVFLFSQCRFALGSSSGAISAAQLFGRPLVATNFPPTPLQAGSGDLVIPQLMWNETLKRYATLREMYAEPLFFGEEQRLYTSLGYRFEKNSPEDIAAVTREMVQRVFGVAEYSAEDEELQRRARALFPEAAGINYCRFGRDYLRQYQFLLD